MLHVEVPITFPIDILHTPLSLTPPQAPRPGAKGALRLSSFRSCSSDKRYDIGKPSHEALRSLQLQLRHRGVMKPLPQQARASLVRAGGIPHRPPLTASAEAEAVVDTL